MKKLFLASLVFVFSLIFVLEVLADQGASGVANEGLKIQAEDKLKEVFGSYVQINDFSCDYSYTRAGKSNPVNSQKGTLKFKKPFKLNYVYELPGSRGNFQKPGFIITDGQRVWDYCPEIFPPNDLSAKLSVFLSKVEDFEKMPGRGENFLGQGEFFPDLRYPAINFPQEAGNPKELLGHYIVKIPEFALEPLKGISRERISFDKEEEVNGVRTYCFMVRETEASVKSLHWIAVMDGIPRRIWEYDWSGKDVANRIELDKVNVNLKFPDQEFTFQSNQEYTVEDVSKMAQAVDLAGENALDFSPEDAFRYYFNMPLDAVSGLKGSGMAFRGAELYISFKTQEKVELKNQGDYQPADSKDAAEFFAKYFLEDKDYLANPENLNLFAYIRKGSARDEGAWLLHNQRENIYYFRAWEWAD